MDAEPVASASKEVQRGFVRKVYGILAAQLFLTIIIAAPLQLMGESLAYAHPQLVLAVYYVSIAATIVLLCCMSCCPSVCRNFPSNYLFLFTFTFFEAILIGFACATYSTSSVIFCFMLTAWIFVALTIYACCTNTDFTTYGPYLMGFFLAVCTAAFAFGILGLAGVRVPFVTEALGMAFILIFVIFIIYDTQCILGAGKGHNIQFTVDDYVFASLNLYLDIINLFLQLLRMFGDN